LPFTLILGRLHNISGESFSCSARFVVFIFKFRLSIFINRIQAGCSCHLTTLYQVLKLFIMCLKMTGWLCSNYI